MWLLDSTREFDRWDRRRLHAELLDDLIQEGAIFIERDDELVACAAVCNLPLNRPMATLMYVVTAPLHRGKGLGRAVTAAALDAARKAGYPGVVLLTDDHREPAIRTYFSLGFEPVLQSADATERWSAVRARLGMVRGL